METAAGIAAATAIVVGILVLARFAAHAILTLDRRRHRL